jgi:hypothetical protein
MYVEHIFKIVIKFKRDSCAESRNLTCQFCCFVLNLMVEHIQYVELVFEDIVCIVARFVGIVLFLFATN